MKPHSAVALLVSFCGAAGAASAQTPLAQRLVFNSLRPCRIVDTRQATAGALAGGETRAFHVVGSASDFADQGGTEGGCGIPGFAGPAAQAQVVAFNFVSVQPAGVGSLRAWPSDQAPGGASILNYAQVSGLALANAIDLPVRQDAEGADLTLRAQGARTHLVVDVVGYYQLVTQLDGSGSGIDADLLDGLDANAFAAASHQHDAAYWKLNGNTGTTEVSFLGTTDNQPLEFRINNFQALRLEPGRGAGGPNVIGGNASSSGERVSSATVAGGSANHVAGSFAFVGGGSSNEAGEFAVSGGGAYNRARGREATVLGGFRNEASGPRAVVGGGAFNQATGEHSAVLAGRGNQATAAWAVVAGGDANQAKGSGAFVAGGFGNLAAGSASFAGGTNARAQHDGAFVWSSTLGEAASTGPAQFIVRAQGGLWLGDAGPVAIPDGVFLNTSTGAHLTSGGAWTNASDVALKHGFEPVDGQAVLDAVARLPIASWSYRAESDAIRHLGPTAQDFRAAFGLGRDDHSITTVDADGVALAAIQELERRTREVETLRQELQELRRVVDELKARPR